MLEVITGRDEAGTKAELLGAALDELARAGAQRMIAAALRVEADEYVARHQEARAAPDTRWWCAMDRHGPQQIGEANVVDEPSAAGEEPLVFTASRRLADHRGR
jgi:hypothetical protein